mgnify:CR=1 FL=1
MNNNNNVLGERLYTARRQRSLSRQKLADSAQVTASCIKKWEEGQNSPNVYSLIRMADILNVSIDWLCGRERYIK